MVLEDLECRRGSAANPEPVPLIGLGEEVLDQELEVFANAHGEWAPPTRHA
jgi:hypothetical protein